MVRLFRLCSLLIVLIAAFALIPGTALGQKSATKFHSHFTDSFSSEVCGIPVDVKLVVTDNFFISEDGSIKDTGSSKTTYTNPVNGKSVLVSAAGQIIGTSSVDEAAGTITFITSYKGLPEKIKATHGSVLIRDAGIISFRDTFNLETGEFISSETIIKGPHPEADSDFTLFCDVISAALT